MNKSLLYGGVLVAGLIIAVATTWPGSPPNTPRPSHQDAPFDFYVLALSWSPAFCASERGQGAALQCGRDADFGFITHGLWPQFEDGWPSFCQSPHGDRMPRAVAESLLDIMPDRGLIAHQWDKHGTCTGLSPAEYADMTLAASRAIAVPPLFTDQVPQTIDAQQVEQAFTRANPGMSEGTIAVSCPGGRFTEVRICLNQDLTPRTCAQVNRNGCAQTNVSVTPR